MDEKLKVSIIIPCGGKHSAFVDDAVNSCLKADPPPDKIIVIDDTSNPPIKSLLNQTNNGLKLYKLDEHKGRSYARNFAVTQTNTPWLYFLDADDFLEPTAIADFRKIVSNLRCDLLYADYEYISKTGKRIKVEKSPFSFKSPYHNPVNIGMFVRRERFLTIGGFDEDMQIGEYWDFFLKYAINPHIRLVKHNRPFFVARQASSALPNAQAMMERATLKIQAMIRGGYYHKGWANK